MQDLILQVLIIIVCYISQMLLVIPIHFGIRMILDSKPVSSLVTVVLSITFTVAMLTMVNIMCFINLYHIVKNNL